VTVRGGDFVLSFRYDPGIVAAVKLLPGRKKWDPQERVWIVPKAAAAPLRALVRQYEFEVDDDAREVLSAASEAEGYHVFADEHVRTLTIRTGWVKGLPDALRQIKGRRWRPERKEWTVPADEADTLADIVAAYGLRVHPVAQPLLRAWSDDAARLRTMSRSEDADIEIPRLAPGMALRPFQRGGVAYALAAGCRTIIGDEPGLGKTVQCLATAEIVDRWPVVVVAPRIAVSVWAREVKHFFPHRSVRVLRGMKPSPLTGPHVEQYDYYVIGYAVLHRWQRALLRLGLQGLICDESQELRGSRNLRTIAAKALAGVREADQEVPRGAVPADGLVLLASGTPIMNGTAELIEQLAIIGKLGALGGIEHIRRRYIRLAGLTDEERVERRRELNEVLRATGCIVRRSKKKVLPELPPKQRSFVWVEPDPKYVREYQRAEADTLGWLADRARTIAAEIGEDPASAAVMARMRAKGAEALVRIGVLRQITARSKLAAAREWTEAFLASGQQLGVYAHHREIVDEVAAALGGARKIYGGQTDAVRQDAIDGFQEGRYPVVVVSIKAAGVGITLTAASNALFLEYAWNPGTLTQTEDRHHRIGQKNAVNATYLLAEGLQIDADMCELVEAKRAEVDNVTDGEDVEDWDAVSSTGAVRGAVATELLERMTRRALGVEEQPPAAPAEEIPSLFPAV
jgi:hypothetical protein